MRKLVFRTASLTLTTAFVAGCALFPGEEPKAPEPPPAPPVQPQVEAPPEKPLVQQPRKNRRIITGSATQVRQPATVWDDFRDYGQLDIELDNPRIREHRNWYARNGRYLNRVLTQAEPYWHYVQSEAIRRGLPPELALIPIIESGYNPIARGRGPAGLWQFMPGTAKILGVRQNGWFDGRLDVIASTDAAFRYLETLNQHFDGDWLLTLAAYNAGEGTIKNAMAANRRRGQPTDFWSLNLRSVTRNYIPKIIALTQVLNNPARFNLTLPPIPNYPYFTVVDTGGQIGLNEAARMAGTSVTELRRLNSGLRGSATDPAGPHQILIPVGSVERFRQALASTPPAQRISVAAARPPAAASSTQGVAGKNRKTHQVATGESLWTIARQYKVSVNTLAQWNGISPKAPLRAGKKLVVWVP